MKKLLYIIIAALLIISSVSACSQSDTEETKDGANTGVNYESTDTSVGTSVNADNSVKYSFSDDITIRKAGEGAEIGGPFTSIVDILNGGAWIKGVPECEFIYTLGVDDKTIKYHDDCGTFYNETDGYYMTVSEEDKGLLNDILGMIFERIYEDW